jgi:hypothetical protein
MSNIKVVDPVGTVIHLQPDAVFIQAASTLLAMKMQDGESNLTPAELAHDLLDIAEGLHMEALSRYADPEEEARAEESNYIGADAGQSFAPVGPSGMGTRERLTAIHHAAAHGIVDGDDNPDISGFTYVASHDLMVDPNGTETPVMTTEEAIFGLMAMGFDDNGIRGALKRPAE